MSIPKKSGNLLNAPHIKAYPHKLQIVHTLEEKDNDHRVEMRETLLNRYENDPSILDDIWFSNKAVFHLSERVNQHNIKYRKQKILNYP